MELARCQAGVLSRAQLLGLGVSAHRIERLSVTWMRLARGVYLIGPDVGAPPWLARVWAGVLLGGEGSRAAGPTAAALQGLSSPEELATGPGAARTPPPIHVLVPGRHIGPHRGFVFSRERPGSRLRSPAGDPPRTRIEDTTLDLCASADKVGSVTWLTRACQRRLTTAQRLRRRALDRPALRHRSLVLEILQDVGAGATSQLEYRALREVLRPHGLPGVRLQHRTGTGNRVADAAVEAHRVLIEFDGRVGHVEEGAFRDRHRDNAHTLDGWVTLRFGWSDVSADPCGVAAQIARLLLARGWPGPFRTCPRCPRHPLS
jgi:very-short-patch-repair endonuclease